MIDQGMLDFASTHLAEGLDIARSIGDKRAIAYLLENFARVALLQGNNLRFVQLGSVAATLRTVIATPLPDSEQIRFHSLLASARAELGNESFEQAWQHGKTLSQEQAIDFALQNGENNSPLPIP